MASGAGLRNLYCIFNINMLTYNNDMTRRSLNRRRINGHVYLRALLSKLAVLMKLLQIFFLVILAMRRNFYTNFEVFLPQLKCPNMVMYYFDEKSTLVSAVLKIDISN